MNELFSAVACHFIFKSYLKIGLGFPFLQSKWNGIEGTIWMIPCKPGL